MEGSSATRIGIPSLPLHGGCQCGNVRYRILGDPVTFYLCHCRECQRHTSSAFGESLRVRASELAIEGELACISRLSDSGKTREGRFCRDCGVRIVHGTPGDAEVNVKAGTLDDTSWLMPAGHIWTRSRQPFIRPGEGELCYATQPPDNYAELARRFRLMAGR